MGSANMTASVGSKRFSLPQIVVVRRFAKVRPCDSADFDGTTDFMTRGAGLTGVADSKLGTLSCWARLAGNDFQAFSLLSSSLTSFVFERDAGNFTLHANDTTPVTVLGMQTVLGNYVAGLTWWHILASWNLAIGATHLFINDQSERLTSTLIDAIIDYTHADWHVASSVPTPGADYAGALAEFWFAPGQYLNLNAETNRRKFITSSRKPAHLGSKGERPTGIVPAFYFHLDKGEAAANFAIDRSTSGNTMSISGGLTIGSTSPSD